MSAVLVQRPIWAVKCNRGGCLAVHTPAPPYQDTKYRARVSARMAGWQIRPHGGPGSRSAPDYCPKHKESGDDV